MAGSGGGGGGGGEDAGKTQAGKRSEEDSLSRVCCAPPHSDILFGKGRGAFFTTHISQR